MSETDAPIDLTGDAPAGPLFQCRGHKEKPTIRPMPAPPPIRRVRRSTLNARIGL